MEDYAWLCINARIGNALIFAEECVGQLSVPYPEPNFVRSLARAVPPCSLALCVLHASLAGFSIGADNDRLMLGGPHRQLVIFCSCQASGTCCPALMATVPQYLSHCGVHVVIKQESH